MNNNQIKSKVKQGYFFLDYLRLHAYGKENGIFKKNRHMMSSENAEDPKRGYTSYIQRIFRTLLDNLFPYLEIVKPRDVFGYNVGPKDSALYARTTPSSEFRALDIMTNKFHGILYIFRRNMIYGEFKEHVRELVRTIEDSEFLKHRDRAGFFKIRLNQERSGGWKALKECKKVAKIYDDMVDEIKPEEMAKTTLSNILDKIKVLSHGQIVYKKKLNNHEPDVSREYVVDSEDIHRDVLGYVSNVNYRLSRRGMGSTSNFSRASLFPMYSSENESMRKQMEHTNNLLTSFKDHWIHIYSNSVGFSPESVFNLARNSFVKTLDTDSDRDMIFNLDIMGSDSNLLHQVIDEIACGPREHASSLRPAETDSNDIDDDGIFEDDWDEIDEEDEYDAFYDDDLDDDEF